MWSSLHAHAREDGSSRLVVPLVVAVVLLLVATVAYAIPSPGDGSGPPGGEFDNSPAFEFDGNLRQGNDGPVGELDWVASNGTGLPTAGAVLADHFRNPDGTCEPTDPTSGDLEIGLAADAPGGPTVGMGVLICDGSAGNFTDANTFTQGSKNGDSLGWVITGGSNPKKGDLASVMLYVKLGDSTADADEDADDLFFFFDATRLDVNGSTNYEFEINRHAMVCDGAPVSGSEDAAGNCVQDRAVGDIIVALDSSQGGQNPIVRVFEYLDLDVPANASKSCVKGMADNDSSGIGDPDAVNNGCYVDAGASLGISTAIQSTVEIDAWAWQAVGCEPTTSDPSNGCKLRDEIPAKGNLEAVVDLTAARGGQSDIDDLCPGFGQVMGKSRASDEISGALKDIAGPEPVAINLCGSLLIEKLDGDGALLGGATFTIDPNPFTGVGTLEITDGSSDDPDGTADGVVCLDDVLPDTYDITETGVPAGYFGDADTETTPQSNGTCASRLPHDPTDGDADASFTNTLGSILIQKLDGDGTALAGATFTITPDAATDVYADTIVVADGGTGDQAAADGLVCVDDVHDGSWTVTETGVPDGYFGDDAQIVVTPVSADDCATRLAAYSDGDEDAEFTNRRGSIVIRKTQKDASAADGSSLHGGATFSVDPDATTDVYADGFSVTDDDASDVYATAGVICIDDVPAGTWDVTETSDFPNHAEDEDTEQVTTVDATCAERLADASDDETAVTPDAEFENVPLSSITVTFSSDAGDGLTVSRIQCFAEDGTTELDPDGVEGTGDTAYDDASETFSGLLPNSPDGVGGFEEYTCTISIDP